jgi:hypothetical protein
MICIEELLQLPQGTRATAVRREETHSAGYHFKANPLQFYRNVQQSIQVVALKGIGEIGDIVNSTTFDRQVTGIHRGFAAAEHTWVTVWAVAQSPDDALLVL